jgi:hypothetical protein
MVIEPIPNLDCVLVHVRNFTQAQGHMQTQRSLSIDSSLLHAAPYRFHRSQFKQKPKNMHHQAPVASV